MPNPELPDTASAAPRSGPAVTIAMSARNSARTLPQALRSIVAQDFTDWELLLYDDGSSDATPVIARRLRDPRIRLVTDGRSLGLAARLNEAIDAARGRYFARIDADDVMFPDRLRLQVAFLEAHPEVDLLGGAAVVFGDDGEAYGRYPVSESHEQICRRPWSGFHLAHPTWMGRIEWFRRYRYRAELSSGTQDQDLLLRSWRDSRFANLPQLLIGYRQPALDWRKFARGRMRWARIAMAEARRVGDRRAAASVASSQFAKGAFETCAILSGFGRRLLAHRAAPLAPEESERWKLLWERLQRASRGSV